MATLLIMCPVTDSPISTGIETDQSSVDRLPDVLSRTRCPKCGREHVWWPREAWLSDAPKSDDAPPRPASAIGQDGVAEAVRGAVGSK
jgi:hypothetical protein